MDSFVLFSRVSSLPIHGNGRVLSSDSLLSRLHTPLERATVYPVYGTFIGAWLGVATMALDWDRPWQAWPLPLVFGSILGFIAGGLGSFVWSAADEAIQAGREEERAATAGQSTSVQASGKKTKKSKKRQD